MENKEKTEAKPEEKPEFKGRNLEDVISLAEHVLRLPREQFNYEIVTEKTKLFGTKTKEIVIRAWPKKESEENAAADFLTRLMPVFPLDLTYEVKKGNEVIYVIFGGEDKNLLLRNEGALLLSIQHILNKVSPIKVQVDCEFFRKRKEKMLQKYGLQVAQDVSQSGKDEVLDFMNPYERRIIHIAVNQVPGITSKSIGDGFLKRIKVFPLPR
jgi:spoIIIJ-associated protein